MSIYSLCKSQEPYLSSNSWCDTLSWTWMCDYARFTILSGLKQIQVTLPAPNRRDLAYATSVAIDTDIELHITAFAPQSIPILKIGLTMGCQRNYVPVELDDDSMLCLTVDKNCGILFLQIFHQSLISLYTLIPLRCRVFITLFMMTKRR